MRLELVSESDPLLCFDAGAIRLYVELGEANGPVAEFVVPDLKRAKAELVAAGCTIVGDDPSVQRLYVKSLRFGGLAWSRPQDSKSVMAPSTP
jgi:hypothetical protein